MTGEVELGAVYAGSDGRYYAADEREYRLEAAIWRPCLRDECAGRELVETSGGGLLLLERIPETAIPEWIEPCVDSSVGVRLVDTRRTLPPGVDRAGSKPTDDGRSGDSVPE